MSAFDELLDLLIPTPCGLCGLRGSPLCSACLAERNWYPRAINRDCLPGAVASVYGSAEGQLIQAFKEKGQTSLLPFLALPLARPLCAFASGIDRPLLVPIPSSKSNYLKRGFVPAKLFAKKLNRVAGHPAHVADELRFNRIVADQSSLDVRSRALNLAGSMSGGTGLSVRQVILIDDIVTSGATILEAARAATEAGATVIGFLAFSETILKTQPQT